jgi:hypothetical protein
VRDKVFADIAGRCLSPLMRVWAETCVRVRPGKCLWDGIGGAGTSRRALRVMR